MNNNTELPRDAADPQGFKGYFVLLKENWMDIIKLNLLFLVGCLAVISIPAAVTAMCRIVSSMLRREKYSLAKDFFSAMKAELFSSLLIGLFVGAGMAVGIYGVIATRGAETVSIAAGNLTQAGCILLFFCSLNVGIYAFPMNSLLELPAAVILKNSLLLLIIELKHNLAADLVFIILTGLTVLGLPFDLPLIVVGCFSLCCFTLSYITRHGIKACTL